MSAADDRSSRVAGLDFTGRRALVTGGTHGIGRAVADAFLTAGAEVIVTGTRETLSHYEDAPARVRYLRMDARSAADRAVAITAMAGCDILINNAAITSPDEYSVDGFRETLEVNLIAVLELSAGFATAYAGREGAIVNIGSVATFRGLRRFPAYTASKAGLLGLTRTLADQYAPRGVRVNLVAPGYVDTPGNPQDALSASALARLTHTIPMRRWAAPSEIAGAVLFLASPLASYITGTSLAVDGGYMTR